MLLQNPSSCAALVPITPVCKAFGVEVVEVAKFPPEDNTHGVTPDGADERTLIGVIHAAVKLPLGVLGINVDVPPIQTDEGFAIGVKSKDG